MIMYREVLAMNKAGERLYNGIIKENPTFVPDAGNVSDSGGDHIGQ